MAILWKCGGFVAFLALLVALGGKLLEEPPHCKGPGIVKLKGGTCRAPQKLILAGHPPRSEPSASSFILTKEYGQMPYLHPLVLATAGLEFQGALELLLLYVGLDDDIAACHQTTEEGGGCKVLAVTEVIRCTDPCPYMPENHYIMEVDLREVQITLMQLLPLPTPRKKAYEMPVPLPPGVKLPHYLSLLGKPGWIAYGTLLRFANISCPRETVLINSAAEAAGGIMGQMAKMLGCRVIGVVTLPEHVKRVQNDLGFDAALSSKQLGTVEAMTKALKSVAPDGVDFFYDNLGGLTTTAAWPLLNDRSRVGIGGRKSYAYTNKTWNTEDWFKDLPREDNGSLPLLHTPKGKPGASTTLSRGRRITAMGINYQYLERYWPYQKEFYQRVPEWIAAGKLKAHDTFYEGLDKFPNAFEDYFVDRTFGHPIVRPTGWHNAKK